ncbi:hypothetical protein BLS_005101 [Venturia inaequalis]|uniref:Uncharacterized protein n=1 Tax=Venturia inaequalis TaxID=5025 RepID=A0A8H3UHD6_VENIN|nr:hypothetical protein BLS_005101 [Venturia inaequalis]KAE9974761.1 hypothetical protein EG328_003667 [Venturia inaequalis]KAE9975401.1 hypothetical protein EG327_008453 [Venturia inaequalis]RDI81136.1 hypothetical protein Vi05172_g9029 [Venturia inaequalis]
MSRYVSSQFIKTITAGAKTVTVEYVDRTTSWTRPSGFPTSSVKEEFAKVAVENAASLKPETVKVAMKESEHQSDKDRRMHYTVFEINKDHEVVATTHLVRNV